MFDWNDLRFFLAVLEEGSTLAASKRLRVSQTTVARRIEALEEALGVPLFKRLRTGFAPTETGSGLAPLAREAEAALAAFESRARSNHRQLQGTVRLTTNELYANSLLLPILPEFRAQFPTIQLDVISLDRLLDLGKGEADIALRAASRVTQPDLVGRRLGSDREPLLQPGLCSGPWQARFGGGSGWPHADRHRAGDLRGPGCGLD